MADATDVTDGIRDGLGALTVDINTLTPYPGNPRRGHIAAIAQGLEQFGQYKPLVVQASTGNILVGNQTYAAAKQLGWTHIAAAAVDVDDDTAIKILTFDNRAGELGHYDGNTLADLLTALPDLEGTGFAHDDLSGLLEDLRLAEAAHEPDPAGDPPRPPHTGDEHDEDDDEEPPIMPAGGDAPIDDQDVTYRVAVECDTRAEEDALLRRYLHLCYPVTRIFGQHRPKNATVKVRLEPPPRPDDGRRGGPIEASPVRIHDSIAHLATPLDGLAPYGANPRRGDVAAIAESLTRFGQYRPIVIRYNGTVWEVLAGNHTYLAAVSLGWDEIAAVTVTLDDEAAAKLVIWDNRASDLGTNDERSLAELLGKLGELGGTGYSSTEMDALLARVAADVPPLYGVVIDCADEANQVALLAELGADPRYRVRAILS